jgi:uncharacterized protein (TIGR02996 family)
VKALERAAELFETGESVAGLEALLAVWRETRAADVAEVIHSVGVVMSRGLPEIASPADWIDTVNRRRVWDVDRLMNGLMLRPHTQLKQRLARLERIDDDPRISWGLAHALEEQGAASLVTATVFKLLARHRDLRIRPHLLRRRKAPEERPAVRRLLHRELDRVLSGLDGAATPAIVDRQLAKRFLGIVRTLSVASPATLEQFEAQRQTAPNAGEAFLQAVYDDPSSDAPRKVYADWLMQRGDPRGEFIALQCGPSGAASLARQNELFVQHGTGWLGALEPVVVKSALYDFDRGFLSIARVRLMTAAQIKEIPGARDWALIRRINDESPPKAHRALMARGAFPNVEEIDNGLVCGVAASMGPCPRLKRLVLDLTYSKPEEHLRLAQSGSFPAVRRVDAFTMWEPAALIVPLQESLSGAIGARIEGLTVSARDSSPSDATTLRRWLELAQKLPRLKELTVHGAPRICFERRGKRWHLHAENTDDLARGAATALKRAIAEVNA